MASLSSGLSFGNANASSLFKSAASLRNTVASYNDEVARLTYENSAKTDADLAAYQSYLQSRISQLRATGSVTDATKALTFTQDAISAQSSNISASIQRENIAIMAGGATNIDKYNLISQEYATAVNIGDLSLAQTLESQAYSLSQTIQNDAAKAKSASAALTDVSVGSLQEQQKILEQGIKNAGEKGVEAVIKNQLDVPDPSNPKGLSLRQELATGGVVLPSNAQPSVADIMQGIAQAQINTYAQQYAAYALTDPAKAQTALNNGANIMNGYTKFNLGGLSMTFQELQIAANNPDAIVPKQSSDGQTTYAWNKVAGMAYQTFSDGNGHQYTALAPDYGGGDRGYNNRSTYLSASQVQMLQQAGFDTKSMTKTVQTQAATYNPVTGAQETAAKTTKQLGANSGISARLTDNAPDWLKNIIGDGSTTAIFSDNAGNTYFSVNNGTDANGNPITDKLMLQSVGGKLGAFWQLPDGQFQQANSDYGYNWGAASLLLNMGQQIQRSMQDKVSVDNLPKTLPTINIPAVQAPPQTVSQSTAQNQLQQTAKAQNIQRAAPVQQSSNNAAQTVQNAAGNLQSGGSGIKITGTTNAPVGIKL